MEPIKQSLAKWMKQNKNFQENYIKIREEVLRDPEISEFLSHHPDLSKNAINKGLMKLYEYKSQSKQCNQCESFSQCKNIVPGYSPILRVENGEIHLTYEKCHSRIMYEKEQKQQKLVQSVHVPKEILNASLHSLDKSDERNAAIYEMLRFLKEAEKGLPQKGLYLYGPFGVGKTYFLGAIANELKRMNISSMLIYMPEFVREIKSSFKNDTTDEKLEYFKKADVLMLDDIGAEMQSPWFRDEILGSILQFRMMEQLPVFFTSNYSLNQLEELLSTTRDGIEQVKAGRIIERINQVSKEIPLFGENRRR